MPPDGKCFPARNLAVKQDLGGRDVRRSIQIFRNFSIFLEGGTRAAAAALRVGRGFYGLRFRIWLSAQDLAFSFLIASRTLAALAAFGFSAR